MEIIPIITEMIRLDQFLKWVGIAATGAEAKQKIRECMVKVNGEIVTERGKKLRKGDIVEVTKKKYKLG